MSRPHDTHVNDGINNDLLQRTRDDYLTMAEGWVDPFPPPLVINHDGINVVREDVLNVGSKARFGSLFVERCPRNTLVYVAPRVGYAAVSLAHLAKQYGKRLVLFSPACRELSHHQLAAYEAGATFHFVRVSAMPNLNRIAADYANKRGYEFVPLGLRHPLVTAAIVRTCQTLTDIHGAPNVVWTVMSTGVLSRGLQIGWPDSEFVGVAVARNMKAGESGRATVTSHDQDFYADARILPPFPSVTSYDAKMWEHIIAAPRRHNEWAWNVAGPMTPTTTDPASLDSWREWNEMRHETDDRRAMLLRPADRFKRR